MERIDEAGAAPGRSPAARGPEPHLTAEIAEIGRSLARRNFSAAAMRRAPHERGMSLVGRDPEVRAALLQLVDVAPACENAADLAGHLHSYLSRVGGSGRRPVSIASGAARTPAARGVTGRVARVAINRMAHRFIVGSTPDRAARELRRMWDRGNAISVDLLGEATLTEAEGVAYANRCDQALKTLAVATREWDPKPILESDAAGSLPRANLSVKVTALTPLVRPQAPDRGRRDAAEHLRRLLRTAAGVGAHLHVDMESMDSREMVFEMVLAVLAEDEFRSGPSAGLVLQAYLRDSEEMLDEIIEWASRTERADPLAVRLVKGAYWDQEHIEATQHGWVPPVWSEKADSDRCFERITRRLVDSFPLVRPAIASHNLRSLAHAIAYARHRRLATGDLELQVLRGLGDDLAEVLARDGHRARVYSPVGDLVSGMAYLVRRLLENTSNDSFLADRAAGADLDSLLASP
ncbi:MAG: proline dehydrogenase family protein [Solirubrobacterales bacterium]